ncbi:MAG: complex I subunit 5 family protein [Thermoleophilaceae bacterium]
MTHGVGHLAALPIVVPLLTATWIAITNSFPRRVHEATAIAAAVATTVICAVLLVHVRHEPLVYWMGGWRPHHGVALGISLTIDQLGAGMATLTAALLTAAIVYSTRYFDEIDGHFYALMLVFMAGMAGFALTGDVFNMFVFFELMGVAAFALTALEVEESGPLQGAINFAVTNSVAGFAFLMGVGLLYGRTGALNMAQIGASLDHHPADALVAVALTLTVVGLLTKAAAVPIHFWLADAHAVAPAPVCVLFSGAMVELGVFGAARLLSTAFAQPIEPATDALRAVLVGIGVVTAVVAAITCFEQRHIKRLLAFSTVSNVGVLICGLGLLTGHGLGGAATYTIGHGLAKAALFLAAGTVLYRHASIDEYDLRGRARDLPLAGLVFAVGGLLLASAPLGTTFFGKSLVEDAALSHGYTWLPAVLAVCSAVTGGAVLRVGARVFLGWGAAEHPRHGDESEERSQEQEAREEGADFEPHAHTPPVLVAIPLLLMTAAVVAGLVPGLVPSIDSAAAHFRDHAAYFGSVLRDAAPHYPRVPDSHVKAAAWIYAAAGTAGAIAIAAFGLFGRALAERMPRAARRVPEVVIDVLRAAHSGHVGDYVAWWTFAVTVVGGLMLWSVAG